MKSKRISIKTIAIILLISIIITLVIINLNNKNTNITKQESSKEQLETTSDNAYISMQTHLSEVSDATKVDESVAATADNISEGKQAWVNGKLITGNGADNIHYRNLPFAPIDPELPFEILTTTTGIKVPYLYTSSNSVVCGTIPVNFDNVSTITLNTTFYGDNSASPIIDLAITDNAISSSQEIISNSIWNKTVNHWTTGNTINDTINVNNISGYKYISLAFRPGYAYEYEFRLHSLLLK